ncbi:non-SMC mitotic condensation complex subunit 1-domain-containing protein, partial [Gymnopilus junonius]
MVLLESFELQDELQALQEIETYEIPYDKDFTTEDPENLLEAAVEAVAESSDSIRDAEVFDAYRSLLKHSDAVPGPIMSKLLDSISSGLQAEMESTLRDIETGDQHTYMAHKMPLEMYAFLLNWFVTAAEKVKASEEGDAPAAAPAAKGKKGKGKAPARGAASKKNSTTWTWQEQVVPTLNLIAKFLNNIQSQRLWLTTAERDTFITCITRPAYYVSENEQYMKVQEIKLSVFKVFCRAVKHHGQAMALQIHIMQSLQFWEHLSEPMADCLTVLSVEFSHTQLGDEVLREIAAKNFGGQDTKGPRAFARFLVKYAESCPRAVLKQLSLLLRQLDSESYPMRQAIIEIIGFLITELANIDGQDAADAKQDQKQVNNMFSLLMERILDVSGYVRSKVFNVMSKLVEIKGYRYPKQRLEMTMAAVEALDDKIASVRKAAIALLQKLILTHPYGVVHGGTLDRDVFEKSYKEACADLEKIEGAIGNVVQETEGQGDEEEDEEEGGEDENEGEEGSQKKKKSKKSKKARGDDDDSMDIDDEVAGDTEEDEPEHMSTDEDEEGNKKSKKKKGSKLKPRKSQLDLEALNNEQVAVAQLDEKQLNETRMRKKYCSEALTFIDKLESAMDPMCALLGSTSKAEVLEIMDFFRVAHEYQFDSAKDGLKKMLHLIWSKDNSNSTSEDGTELKGVPQRLIETYRSLYFDPIPDLEPKEQVNRIAKNLIERTYEATLAELTSLEEMMRIMMKEGRIHSDVIAKLWQVYGKDRHLPKAQRRGAIMIIGMLALSNREILKDKIDIMLKIGLGSLVKTDPTLARYTSIALQRLGGSEKKVKGSSEDKTERLEMTNNIFRKLENAILLPSRTKEWFGMAEQIINTVYALGERPDVFCDAVIKKLTTRAFTPKKKTEQAVTEKDTAPEAMAEDQTTESGDVTMQDATQTTDATQTPPDTTQTTQSDGEKDLGEAFELSQLLFVVGHVAIKHIVFLELVERELKRQKEERHAAEKKASANQRASKDVEELEQVAGNAEDEIGERVQAIRETELLFGPESLLTMYGPMLVHICGSPQKFKNRTLRAAATLALSKFLCVSPQFCDENHRLLFKILETSKDKNIRSNIVIALGDVAVSFSTIIDENSNELYRGLSDKDLVVKKNTLMVLTHLILNGMIKVKGQLGEMAKCLEDPEQRIADLAKLFFEELSTKENAIYNNLPDVISHLSTGEHAVDEDVFQSTLRYIFKFIEKEKQAETIVEKLCQRFRLSEDPRQWRDVAFCLSLLPFKSERSVKKLIDGLQFYRDKLHEPKVFERFTEILAKARANKSKDKPEDELNEFEKILEDNKSQGQEDQALEKRVEGKKAAAKKRAAKRSARTKKAAPPPPDEDMYSD